jgi:hypothetical protein
MIGFILGVGVAAAVAYVVTRIPNPFDGRTAKSSLAQPHLSSVERETPKSNDGPRFDFSKILPGTEERKVAKAEPAQAPGADKPVGLIQASGQGAERPRDDKGRFFLQAGPIRMRRMQKISAPSWH